MKLRMSVHTQFSHLIEKLFGYIIAVEDKSPQLSDSVPMNDYILPDILQVGPNADEFDSSRLFFV